MASKKKSIRENERAIGAYQAEAKAIRENGRALTESENKRLEFLDKQQKKLQKVERNIEETEGKIATLEAQLADITYNDPSYHALLNEYNTLKANLAVLMEAWEALAE